MLKKLGKLIAILLGIIGIFFLTMFIAMSISNSPTYAWRILRYGESDIKDYDIFPERPISNGTTASTHRKRRSGYSI